MKINGVFEGGGVKGIALAGAVSSALDNGFKFHDVAGTSSGAIIAAFLAAGYTGKEIKELIIETPFHKFLKRSPIFDTGIIGSAARLLFKKGLYSGDALEDWVRAKLEAKGVRNFGDLRRNQLRIVASDISQGKLLVLPDDIAHYGIEPARFSIARAVRMSTAIPYFFDPVMIRKPARVARHDEPFRNQFVYIVDGAILSNFPLWLFDEPEQQSRIATLGFNLVGDIPKQIHKINGMISMFQALFTTMMDAHDTRYIEENNYFRTVKIPAMGVQTTQFNISVEDSEKLYEAGYRAAEAYFKQWSLHIYESAYEKYVLRRPV
ncbi:patatin-like phospholipase family protein [Paenibacillus sp. FJAT-26967]|uniref:patatin-like phospholipase family protein n=1 Tax=Paenibacillus sp. FJAT-26967 TaxID=1729690 RepID=UPI000838B29D|nr:patatin-like phospholipase family protein [Paenibacillus sp. FJAT-26967]